MSKVTPRDVSWIIQAIRKACFGREYQTYLRFEGVNLAKRSQPKAFLPGGVSHKLHKNAYYDRDARRGVKAPEVLYSTPEQSAQSTPQLKP